MTNKKTILPSANSFSAEYNNLQNNVPQAFWGDTHRYFEFVDNPFDRFRNQDSDKISLLHDLESIDLPDHQITPISSEVVFGDDTFKDEPNQGFVIKLSETLGFDVMKMFDYYLNEASQSPEGGTKANQNTNIHGDYYGCYLPMHAFYKSKATPWGIYMYQSYIAERAAQLFLKFKKQLKSKEKALHFFWMAVYRHELYHYQIERYATKYEVAVQKPFYKPYVEKVRYEVAETEHWLEEALAEASVLGSKLVFTRAKISQPLARKIYEYDLQFMGPGYRDYKCPKYNGPENANKYLGAQILTGNVEPGYEITEMISPKLEYSSNDRAVPGYVVVSKYDVQRFQ